MSGDDNLEDDYLLWSHLQLPRPSALLWVELSSVSSKQRVMRVTTGPCLFPVAHHITTSLQLSSCNFTFSLSPFKLFVSLCVSLWQVWHKTWYLERRACNRDLCSSSFVISVTWLAMNQMHFLLPLDYQRACGVEGDRHMPLTPPPPRVPCAVWVLPHGAQSAQYPACSPLPVIMHSMLSSVLFEAGKQPGFGYWKWWFCRLTHRNRLTLVKGKSFEW